MSAKLGVRVAGVLLLLVAVAPVASAMGADHAREIRGRVLDQNGKPVANVDVSFAWSANGPPNGKNGNLYDFETAAGRKFKLDNHGKMFPLGDIEHPTRTRADGRFSINLLPYRHHLLAIDRAHDRGALAILPAERHDAEIEMRLAPLVRVKGLVQGPALGQRTEAVAMMHIVGDPARPLDATTLANDWTLGGRLQFSLPPGRYRLKVYNSPGDGSEDASVEPDKELLLTNNSPEIDLGVLRLSPYKLRVTGRIARSQAAGTWGDCTKHYGEIPPRWNVVDARGVKADAQISDFKGKWVLAYFWGFGCTPCLKHRIPQLIKFYEDHRAQRDRFEIVALCMDPEGRLKSMADFDKEAQPLVAHVWKKPLPFPVLLDPTFKTWERYGLPAWGILILIDPQGRMVKGDEAVLAEHLLRQ